MKVAVVGATGLVGREILQILTEQNFPVSELIPVASARSVGQLISFKEKSYPVVSVETAISMAPDIALFSAGSGASKEYAPAFAAAGTTVIDNSSAWRMDPNVPLVVPEVNAHAIADASIIANPNCSTIQMVVALNPLHKAFGIDRLVISTYQSVSGTGKAAVSQLMDERSDKDAEQVYPQRIDLNCLPHCGVFLDNDYTQEEMKLVHETRKIMDAPDLRITATSVRVPVIGGHSEAVNIEFKEEFEIAEVRRILEETDGLVVMDDPQNLLYPTPQFAHQKDPVYVGRIRRDESQPKTLNLWIVADNLRKGAATNAVQIAQHLIRQKV
ncbi:UNVERIFIED_CONTAM: hypothetical protein GTU68_003553 [Idotea baltica]|nr:hypothetical protein [Idotea baltica]